MSGGGAGGLSGGMGHDDSFLEPGRGPILPADFDPLAPHEAPFAGPTQSDHAPAINDAFRPPPARMALIPDDWDIELPAAVPPPAPPAIPAGAGLAIPEPETIPTSVVPAPVRQAPVRQAPVTQAPVAPAPVTQAPIMPAPQAAQRVADPAQNAALAAAFLRGVGLADADLADPAETLEHVGAAVRATVSGIRQALMARASIKDEFRIEQTMIRASGNNPLKFSANDDDALATLLGLGRRGGVSLDDAITEALRDMRLHELATVAAMQAAVRVLLAQFDPGGIERKGGGTGLNILAAQRKARAWDAFAALHQSVTQALSDDFDSVFGKAFARAYEQAIDELTVRGTPS